MSDSVRTEVRRIDRYNIEVDGKRIRATPRQEGRIRQMTPEQLSRFLAVMGR